MEDNWIHRSKTMRCITCMYYVVKPSSVYLTNQGEPAAESNVIGRCRRHAPTMSGWPATFPNDWCGDHKLDADKL